jgi:hypothetical protein
VLEVKNRLTSPYWIYRSLGRALPSAHPARINCRRKLPSLTSGTHHDCGGRTSARAPSSRHGNRRAAAGGHVRLPTPPTMRAVAAPEKARLQRLTTAVTAGIKWPGPLPSKEDPRAARAPGSDKNRPSKGAITDQWPRSLFEVKRRHRCPRSTKYTDQRFEGRRG